MPDETPAQPEIKPGQSTSEFKVAAGAAIPMLIPILQSVLTKTGDTRFEVACLTIVAVSYIASRTFVKR